MSRSGYIDIDGWDLIRWRGAVASAVRGTRGQEVLHGLVSALDAMPVKRLNAGRLIAEGEVCALGALGAACGRTEEMRRVDSEDYKAVARFFGISEALAREIQHINDEWYDATPEDRWTRVRQWALDHIERGGGE